MREIRFGLVGLGIHGARYARHLTSDVPGARLAAVCRRDREAGREFAREVGARYFDDFRDLIGAVDAVCAVVPPDLHPEIAEAAAAAGVALLLEKPLAVGVDEARRILRAAASSRAPVMVAHTLRYNRAILRLRDEIPRIGPVHLAALNQRFEPAGRAWLDEPGPGGVILNTGIHEFDTLRFVTGLEARAVSCRTRRVVTERTEDVFAALLDLEPGAVLATVDASRAVGGRSGRIEIAGRDAQLAADHSLGTVHRTAGREARPLEVPAPVPTIRETLLDFARLVRGEIENPIPPLEGARAVAIAAACLRSAAAGGVPVEVEEVGAPA
jgi:predicted dehydrogenase